MFTDSWNAQAIEACRIAIEKGDWYDSPDNQTRIMRMRLDLISVLNDTYKDQPIDERLPGFTLVDTGLANIVIDIMVYGYAKGLDVGRAVEEIIERDAKEIESSKS